VLKGVRVAPGGGLVGAPRAAPTDKATSPGGPPPATTVQPGYGDGAEAAQARGADVSLRDSGLVLVADRGVDLSTHVGHRVLVTGRLSSFAAPGGVASTASGRTLTVTTLNMIAPACTTGS
jgi:hypothetical protein